MPKHVQEYSATFSMSKITTITLITLITFIFPQAILQVIIVFAAIPPKIKTNIIITAASQSSRYESKQIKNGELNQKCAYISDFYF